ncbi:MAG: hypothetical protein J6W70_00445 [Lentisphaeria bacterium]|nr:hypothetical protein [Lentisphaeria bacterium]
MNEIPKGLQTYFLNETESEERPAIRREGANIVIPILIREATKTDESGNEKTIFKFFEVVTAFTGQDTENYEKCCIQSYAAIRKYLYGEPAVQSEMRDDKCWEAHRLAVRATFPKYRGEVIPQIARFEEIKTKFWNLIDDTLAAMGETRSVLPPYFNSTTMLDFAKAKHLSADTIRDLAVQFQGINSDLHSNNRNWGELFD